MAPAMIGEILRALLTSDAGKLRDNDWIERALEAVSEFVTGGTPATAEPAQEAAPDPRDAEIAARDAEIAALRAELAARPVPAGSPATLADGSPG